MVLWSVTARKSSPRARAVAMSVASEPLPSLWCVWDCKSPRYQRLPFSRAAGSLLITRRRSGMAGSAGAAPSRLGVNSTVIWYSQPSSATR